MRARECPFCESPRLEIVEEEVMEKNVLKVRCMACGATGPVNYTTVSKAKAVENWNRRAEFRTYTEVN